MTEINSNHFMRTRQSSGLATHESLYFKSASHTKTQLASISLRLYFCSHPELSFIIFSFLPQVLATFQASSLVLDGLAQVRGA